MSAAEVDVNRPHFGQVYMWSLVIAGAAITLVSIYYFPFDKLDVTICLPLFDGDCEFADRNPEFRESVVVLQSPIRLFFWACLCTAGLRRFCFLRWKVSP